MSRSSGKHLFPVFGIAPFRLAVWIMGALCAPMSVAWHWYAAQHVERTRVALLAQEVASRPPVPALAELGDFARGLPEAAAIDAVVRDLQRQGTAEGAAVISVDAVVRPAVSTGLGRIDVTLVLRGDYSKIKASLGQLLDRYPNLLLQRLSLRRGGSPTELETAVGLSLLTRPAGAPAAGK